MPTKLWYTDRAAEHSSRGSTRKIRPPDSLRNPPGASSASAPAPRLPTRGNPLSIPHPLHSPFRHRLPPGTTVTRLNRYTRGENEIQSQGITRVQRTPDLRRARHGSRPRPTPRTSQKPRANDASRADRVTLSASRSSQSLLFSARSRKASASASYAARPPTASTACLCFALFCRAFFSPLSSLGTVPSWPDHARRPRGG